MQTSSVQPLGVPVARAPINSGLLDFLVGLTLTAVVPALFWVAAFAGVSSLAGYPADVRSLAVAGVSIAAFLGTFFLVFAARRT